MGVKSTVKQEILKTVTPLIKGVNLHALNRWGYRLSGQYWIIISGPMDAHFLSCTELGFGTLLAREQVFPSPAVDERRSPSFGPDRNASCYPPPLFDPPTPPSYSISLENFREKAPNPIHSPRQENQERKKH